MDHYGLELKTWLIVGLKLTYINPYNLEFWAYVVV